MRSLVRSSLTLLLLNLLLFLVSMPALAASFTVNIQNFAFTPAMEHINPGDVITWRNLDQTAHSVHWTSGGLADSLPLLPGQSHSQAFPFAGTYSYICGIHGASMSGTVIVGNPGTPPPTRTPTPTTPAPSPSPTPSPSSSPSPTPTPTPSATPSPAATSARPSSSPSAVAISSPTPGGTGLTSPAAQLNEIIGIALVLIGLAILGGAFWWRFRTS